MSASAAYAAYALFIGVGATLLMDVWSVVRQRLLGVRPLDYGLVGRWLGHLVRGRFRHYAIAASPRVRGERAIGWSAHYLIGIAFAGVLLAVFGPEWARRPTLVPALIVGLGSVAAPFLVLQPGMGAGIAASRAPNPTVARLHSLITHGVFGTGLYAAGRIASSMLPSSWLAALG